MNKLIKIIIALNLLLVLTQLAVSARRATDGDHLSKLLQETAQVEKENRLLQAEILALSSLERVQERAANLQLSRIAAQFITVTTAVASAR